MRLSVPTPSNRLMRAAAAELAELSRHRERLTRRREALLAELRQVDDSLTIVDQRLAMLGELTAPRHDAGSEAESNCTAEVLELVRPESPDGSDKSPAPDPEHRQVLRGPAIREVAVRVLLSTPEQIEALHYRRWYELIRGAGYAVAGKDPVAVFLTQISRSPVVRKATEAGIYELDPHAPARLRERLERLQTELREVTVAQHGPVDLAGVRARRHELDLAISRQERALEEAVRVLGGLARQA